MGLQDERGEFFAQVGTADFPLLGVFRHTPLSGFFSESVLVPRSTNGLEEIGNIVDCFSFHPHLSGVDSRCNKA